MAGLPKHREKIIRAAAELIRRRGLAATGVNDILELSGAPKGSLYHYFPGGKNELAELALRHAGDVVLKTLETLGRTHASPSRAMIAYGELLGGWMAKSGYVDGCPIATAVLEIHGGQNALIVAGRDAFRSWRAAIETMLAKAGVEAKTAQNLAMQSVMMLEGALILARAERDPAPIRVAFADIARRMDAAVGAEPFVPD